MMRAAQIHQLDGPDSVRIADVAIPQAGPGDIVVRVQSAGVSFPEVLQSRGQYQIQPELPFVPGCEVAGTVEWAAPGSDFTLDQRVVALSMLGGFAEFVAVPKERVFALPDDIRFDEGACLLLNYLTALFSLNTRGRLVSGETVLVHGAAGGVGTAAIQISKALGAGRIIAVASTSAKRQAALAAGATDAIALDDFRGGVKELTGGAGVDIVVDPVGGGRFTDSLRSLKPLGRLLVIGFAEGEIPVVKVNRLLLNNVDVVGVGWGAFTLADPDLLRGQWDQLLKLLASGAITPIVGPTFSLDDVGLALRCIDERAATGKVVLHPGKGDV